MNDDTFMQDSMPELTNKPALSKRLAPIKLTSAEKELEVSDPFFSTNFGRSHEKLVESDNSE